MSPPLFSVRELHMLNDIHKNAVAHMLKKRYTPYITDAVESFVERIHERHPQIMESLTSQMSAAPQEKEFWAKTISFYSTVYEKGTIHREGDKHLYQIWAYTDFRIHLLEKLQLDPKKFRFKLESYYIKNIDVGVMSYYNTLILIYRP